MIDLFASAGIGTYYIVYYFCFAVVLAALLVLVRVTRTRWPHWTRLTLGAVVAILIVRLVLFQNPIALRFYKRHLTPESAGLRQWAVLDVEIDKYRRNLHAAPLANIAVGSSQVGVIFSYWVSDPPRPLKVFSLPGMNTLDYVLYQDEIAAYHPDRVILYLSAFDLTAGPVPDGWPLAPSRPFSLPSLLWRLHASGWGLNAHATEIHAFIGSQLFPEYRFSFISKAFLKQWFKERPPKRQAASPLWRVELASFVQTPGSEALQPDPALTAHIPEFISYYLPEWIDYNYTFLRDFIAFCASRHIDVVIAEGQVNPIVRGAKIDALNEMARWRLAELEAQFQNVTFVRAADIYQFAAADYQDLTHVKPQAALNFTRRLSSFLGPPASNSVCAAAFESRWHQEEQLGTEWFRWSDGGGALRLTSREPSDLVLEGQVLSIVRPNIVDIVANGRAIASWRLDDPAWAFHPFEKIEVRVQPDADVLVRFISHNSPVKLASDPRPLTIALKNVSLHRKADGYKCDLNAAAPSLPGVRPWR
jgi:hypothetical protein